MIKARLTSSAYISGDIYIIRERVNYFREGCDCNHTVVGFDGEEYEIFMSIKDFLKAMED